MIATRLYPFVHVMLVVSTRCVWFLHVSVFCFAIGVNQLTYIHYCWGASTHPRLPLVTLGLCHCSQQINYE
jgi:hypothetical protein